MLTSIVATCGLGFGLGLRHAFESDHVAAVSALVASGHGPRRAACLGAFWGAGHALAVVGAGLVLLALGVEVPSSVGVALDLLVAAMLAGLGVRAITGPVGVTKTARSPMGAALVGLVHGASGTAAVVLLVVTGIPSRADGVYFLTVFAVAATLGMTLLSAALALPLGALMTRWAAARRAVPVAAGMFSLAMAAVVLAGALAPG